MEIVLICISFTNKMVLDKLSHYHFLFVRSVTHNINQNCYTDVIFSLTFRFCLPVKSFLLKFILFRNEAYRRFMQFSHDENDEIVSNCTLIKLHFFPASTLYFQTLFNCLIWLPQIQLTPSSSKDFTLYEYGHFSILILFYTNIDITVRYVVNLKHLQVRANDQMPLN